VEGIAQAQLLLPNPYYAFAKALEFFYPQKIVRPGISDKAVVSEQALIGKDVAVFPFSFISPGSFIGDGTIIYPGVFIGENTRIGSRCILYSNVTVRENITIGDRVVIHAGTVIGSDGFGYVFEKGEHYKIPQVGGVVIEDDVEIGSNVSIDRATIGNTLIGKGTKIDNLAQIAHNVRVGEKSLIVAQVGIGGSSEIGSFVSIGGQVAISDHSTVESGTMIAGQSGLAGHITKGVYAGSPAIPHKTWLRAQALYGRMPEMHKKLRELEERMNKLEKGVSHDGDK
jgi:UDP-3-O-[3-hydroxymyristoyl] glucosamine N-acyltransferase